MKIIHTADIHLGSRLQTHLSREKAKERAREIGDTFARMVEYAKQEGVQVILLSGDVFDMDCPKTSEKEWFYGIVRNAAPIEFLYLRGNHDDRTASDGECPNLHRFDEEWKAYTYGDVCISGIELSAHNATALYDTLSLDRAKKNIVMLHATLGSARDAHTVHLASLAGKGIDYLALGHIHAHSSGTLDARGTYAYAGCLEGRGFDEIGEKGFVLLEVEDTVKSTFVPFATRTVREKHFDITPCRDTADVLARLEAALDCDKNDLVRLYLEGDADFDRSDMAEWYGNLSTRIMMNRPGYSTVYSNGTQTENSFTHNSCVEWYNDVPLGEGEGKYPFCRNTVAVAALPDGKTLISIEKSAAIKENMYEEILPLNFPVPNDIFNGGVRRYTGKGFEYTSEMLPDKELVIDTKSDTLTIDGRLTIASLVPGKTLHIVKPSRRSAPVIDKKELKSLYIEYITTAAPEKFHLAGVGEVLSDSAVALTVDAPDNFCADAVYTSSGNIRAVEITGADGNRYLFAANIGENEEVFDGISITPGSSILKKI